MFAVPITVIAGEDEDRVVQLLGSAQFLQQKGRWPFRRRNLTAWSFKTSVVCPLNDFRSPLTLSNGSKEVPCPFILTQ